MNDRDSRVSPNTITPERNVDGQVAEFLEDVKAGLSQARKELQCKYLYDERGSQLFDQICELEEYYPSRTENGIMLENADAIAECIGAGGVLIEYGSGSSVKTRVLLDTLETPRAYVPVDISEEHLLSTAEKLKMDYRSIEIHPLVADFTAGFELDDDFDGCRKTIYFPGSTIGNMEPDDAVALLGRIAQQCGPGGGLLIGFDLVKSDQVLVDAYNDREGITAEFNLNLLERINRELRADFAVEQFKHLAIYNREKARIEIYIESLIAQRVTIDGDVFTFEKGEQIFTEYSHKYEVDGFAALAAKAGFKRDALWTDKREYFAVMHFNL